jgi:hypothetical protein
MQHHDPISVSSRTGPIGPATRTTSFLQKISASKYANSVTTRVESQAESARALPLWWPESMVPLPVPHDPRCRKSS